MTTAAHIGDIVSLYAKHGWKLRRVLLSKPADSAVESLGLQDAEIRESTIDALWFSRRSRPETESWELRRLVGTPFALVEVFDDGTPDDEIEERLREVERRMADTLTRGNGEG